MCFKIRVHVSSGMVTGITHLPKRKDKEMINENKMKDDLIDLFRLQNKAECCKNLEKQVNEIFMLGLIDSNELMKAFTEMARIKANYQIEIKRFCDMHCSTEEERKKFDEASEKFQKAVIESVNSYRFNDIKDTFRTILGERAYSIIKDLKEEDFINARR